MKPNLWGPSAWKFIHAIAMNYPEYPSEEQKEAMLNFLVSLQYILPCSKCSLNYSAHIQQFDLKSAVLNRNNLIDTTIELHNMVNKLNSKRVFSKTEAREEMMRMFEEQAYVPKKMYQLLIVTMIVLLVAVIYFYQKSQQCKIR